MPRFIEFLKTLKIFRTQKGVDLPSVETDVTVLEPSTDDLPFNEERFQFCLLIGMVAYAFLCIILSGLAGTNLLHIDINTQRFVFANTQQVLVICLGLLLLEWPSLRYLKLPSCGNNTC